MRLNGKTAIITGGANGIGLAACERFAKKEHMSLWRILMKQWEENKKRNSQVKDWM